MASEQQQRRVRDENVSEERDVHVEKDLVPNLASHFESLAEKVRDSEVVSAKEFPTGEDKSKVSVTLAGKHASEEESHKHSGGRIGSDMRESEEAKQGEEVSGISRNRGSEIMEGGARTVGKFETTGEANRAESESRTPSLDEISKASQQAQQNSMDAIRRADERNRDMCSKAKETAAEKAAQAKETVTQSALAYGGAVMEKGRQGYDYAKEKLAGAGQRAAEYTQGTAEQGRETVNVVPEYGRAAMEKSQQGLGYAKDRVAGAGQSAAEKAAQFKDVALEKAAQAKDVTAEKAAQAKDVTMESGKGAASTAGKVAVEIVDRAAMVGWGAAHLTAEVAVEGTKMAAKAVTVVAGYAKDTAVAVGSKATEIAAKQAENVKEVAATTGEKAKEYTARKKEEAHKDLESKQALRTGTQIGKEGQTEGEGIGQKVEGAWESSKGAVSSVVGGDQRKSSKQAGQEEVKAGQGVFGAIGETIMEIAQQTTELVAPATEEEDDSFLTEESGLKASK